MPTGYTHAVQDGTITTLKPFAMLCSRAFGALIHMRDDAIDAEIKPAEPASFYQDRVAQARRRLDRLQRMSPFAAQTECQAWNAQQQREWREACDRRAIYRVRYQAMLEQVQAWQEPTPDHARFKAFMLEQLNESVSFDCSSSCPCELPQPKRWPQWLADEIQQARRDVEYYLEKQAEDAVRVYERNYWVRALQASLEAA